MRITYDPTVRAAYVYLYDGDDFSDLRERTTRIDENVSLDMGPDGRVLGIELLDVDEPVVDVYGTTTVRGGA